nr:reverse transcriptase domain-containing protein [Tanacetum cinerariifolium]
MVKEGIVISHKISKNGLEVDRAKVNVIVKLPYSTTVKGVRSFLGHAGFYRRFIQDFYKIARPMTHLLEKEIPFMFSKDCIDAFETLKKKRTEALILVVPDWNLPFKLMCDASDFAIGTVLGQHTNLCLNWEKSNFIFKEGMVLSHKISKNGIEVDKAKVDIAQTMTHLHEKDTPFFFSKECIKAFQTLKRKLTEAPILVAPDWDLPFELMCDESDFAIGAVLGQQKTKHFQLIHYASKTMTDAQTHYTTMEKELLAMVERFRNEMKCLKFHPSLQDFQHLGHRFHGAIPVFTREQVYTRGRRLLVEMGRSESAPHQ